MKTRPRFYLRDTRAKGATPIVLKVVFGKSPVKIPTSVHARPREWSKSSERIKPSCANSAPRNDRLAELALTVNRLLLELLRDKGEVTAERFRTIWEREHAPDAPPPNPTTFQEAYDLWCAERKPRIAVASGKVYATMVIHLNKCAQRHLHHAPLLDDLTRLFIDKFIGYLTGEALLNNVSAWKMLSTLRSFLAWCDRRGFVVPPAYENICRDDITRADHKGKTDLALTAEEYRTIRDADLTDNPTLERVRDAFVFQVQTMMRWSDIQALRPEHRQGDSLEIVTGKNRKRVSIPLTRDALTIWNRYGGPPPAISNQKQNKYLKGMAQNAGLTAPFELVDYRGTERQSSVVQRWECVGTHTAKKTGITLAIERGVSVDFIMQVTGNNRKTIETYIRPDSSLVASTVRDALDSVGEPKRRTKKGGKKTTIENRSE